MEQVLISGGSGFIGKALTRLLLKQGYGVIILGRQPPGEQKHPDGLSFGRWDISRGYIDPQTLVRADYLIHLAGAGVASHRWTRTRKAIIRSSRVEGAELLVRESLKKGIRLKGVLSASAIGYYDSSQTGFLKEASSPGTDFLARTCRDWEAAFNPLAESGIRVVINRLGLVLGPGGPVLESFLKPLRYGLSPILGSGTQWMSWIHLDDACRAFQDQLADSHYQGVYNLVTPNPVTQREFMISLAGTFRSRGNLPIRIPKALIRLMIGEMSVEVLKSCRVFPQRLIQEGFGFHYPVLADALVNLKAQREAS